MKEKIKYQLAPGYEHLEEWVVNLKTTFAKDGETIFKRRNEVKIFEVGGGRLNVKSFKLPNFINRYVYAHVRGSKAERSFQYARKFLEMGIRTPEPVAYLNCMEGGKLKESFYVSLHLDYDFTLREVLLYKVSERDEILRKWVEFTYKKLHKNGIFHLDYSPGNTLITNLDNDYQFSLIDLNRMDFGAINFEKGLRNFRQLDTDRLTLELLATTYATLCGEPPVLAMKKLLGYDKQHRDFRRRREHLKKTVKKMFGLSK